MTELLIKFSEAAKAVSSSKHPIWECINRAYSDYLSDIRTDSLPEELQIFFDSVRLRVTTAKAFGYIDNNDEASYIAQDILYMADVINSGLKKSDEIEAVS